MKRETIVAILGILASIFIAVIVFGPELTLTIGYPTPTVIQPTTSPSSGYQPELIPPLIDTSSPTQTPTVSSTDTPVPTRTPYILSTVIPNGRQLPDLTVTSISDPTCMKDVYQSVARRYLRLTIIVRNIGRGSTHYFGPVNVGVYIVLGQREYSLDEWAQEFNGVIGDPPLRISNIDPNRDITIALAIELVEHMRFGIKVDANSGENPIPETDTMNNTLVRYFSLYCY